MELMPVIFVGHGSPALILEQNPFTNEWKNVALSIPKPKAILCISAHWYSRGQTVSTAQQPETIHDFLGFPEELYAIQYPAQGKPSLAKQAAALLRMPVLVDPARGLDHGAWTVLSTMYPDASVPVCQLSVNSLFSPQQSYQAGQLLAPLREQGILILCSGNIVHNLRLLNPAMEGGYPWANEFDLNVQSTLESGQHINLIKYKNWGLSADYSVPFRDHFDPLLYAAGAAGENGKVTFFNASCIAGSISMTSCVFN